MSDEGLKKAARPGKLTGVSMSVKSMSLPDTGPRLLSCCAASFVTCRLPCFDK